MFRLLEFKGDLEPNRATISLTCMLSHIYLWENLPYKLINKKKKKE